MKSTSTTIHRVNPNFNICFTLFIYFVVFSCISIHDISAQNASVDLKKIDSVFKSFESIKIEQEIKYFPDYNTIDPDQIERFTYKRTKNKTYSNGFEIEKIRNGTHVFTIDHKFKTVVINNVPKQSLEDIYKFNIDSLIMNCISIDNLKYDDNYNGYKLFFKQGKYFALEIMYNRHDMLIKNVIQYYRYPYTPSSGNSAQKPRVEMTTLSFLQNPKLNADELSESRFVTKEKGKYILREKYNDYQLINYLEF